MSLWEELNLLGKSIAVLVVMIVLSGIGFGISALLPSTKVTYLDGQNEIASALSAASSSVPVLSTSTPLSVTHIETPDAVKGIYMTACIAGERRYRDRILAEIKGTAINSLIIDLKDYTGTVSYELPGVKNSKGKGCKIPDLPIFLSELHKIGIYAIARVTVFQDPLYASLHPDIAVQSYAHPATPWADKNGLAFIDPNFQSYWAHIVEIAKAAHAIGFDEINFDYIRFPSDGNMADARFSTPEGLTRADVITNFFQFMYTELSPLGIKTSADIFGQTTVNYDDLGIGQILENTLPYFDYVMPMNYPSHYIRGFMGFANPATKPYEVVNGTMVTAVERAVAASSSPDKLRPWLQAFDLGADYTPEMIKLQIKGNTDAGVKSWILWDAANRYKREQFTVDN